MFDLAVHLVNFIGWIGQGGHSEPLLLSALFSCKDAAQQVLMSVCLSVCVM